MVSALRRRHAPLCVGVWVSLRPRARERQESLSGEGRLLLEGSFFFLIYMFFSRFLSSTLLASPQTPPHASVPPAPTCAVAEKETGSRIWHQQGKRLPPLPSPGQPLRFSAGCLVLLLRPRWDQVLPRAVARRRRQVALWSQGRRRRSGALRRAAPQGPGTASLGPCPPLLAAGAAGPSSRRAVIINRGA